MKTVFFLTVNLLILFPPLSAAQVGPISYSDRYVFRLEKNRDQKVCRHMAGVYKKDFREPWNHRERPLDDAFAKLSYVEPVKVLQNQLWFSAYPQAPEFDAIAWREGRSFFAGEPVQSAPTLVSEFDIDNDGEPDVVIKTQFALSIAPGGGSSPGGMDALWVFKRGGVDLSKPLEMDTVYAARGEHSPRQLSYVTLRYTDRDRPGVFGLEHEVMAAKIIRPFLLEGKTYLSVYVQWAVLDPKARREWMWVMQYRGGGRNFGKGKWEPAEVDTLCRFKMAVTKAADEHM
jgi:hypothetical protein